MPIFDFSYSVVGVKVSLFLRYWLKAPSHRLSLSFLMKNYFSCNPPYCRRSPKKGRKKRVHLSRPPKSCFLKRNAAALIYLKTAAWPLFGHKISTAITAVFFIPAGQVCIYLFSNMTTFVSSLSTPNSGPFK